MKRSILCMILVALFSSGIAYATDTTPIIVTPPPPPPGPGPCRLICIPVTATINDSELAVYFELSIGEATVTVTDDSNNVVYMETIDTDSSSDMQIPVAGWANGNYNLTITYETNTLVGEFSLE